MSRCFGALVLCPVLAWAQVPTAELSGTVTDPTGAVVAGAQIVITSAATNAQRSTLTNDAGIYIAPALQPGTYSVRITKPGFRAAQRGDILLQVSQTARLDVQLEVGNVTETVEISALADVLDTDTTTVGTVIETRRIEDLPLNGRNYL